MLFIFFNLIFYCIMIEYSYLLTIGTTRKLMIVAYFCWTLVTFWFSALEFFFLFNVLWLNALTPWQLPQQENSYDCGLFLLHYLELFLAEAPLNFNPFKLTKFSNFVSDLLILSSLVYFKLFMRTQTRNHWKEYLFPF